MKLAFLLRLLEELKLFQTQTEQLKPHRVFGGLFFKTNEAVATLVYTKDAMSAVARSAVLLFCSELETQPAPISQLAATRLVLCRACRC